MLDDAAVFSILSKCFASVDKAEWENLSAREAWAEFLDGARFILQNGGSLGLDKSPADYRRGNHAPLQDFLSECEVCALFCPPTYEEKRQFAARHFTGGLPESALPIESLCVNTAKAGDLLSPVDGKGMYLGTSARYMSALAEQLGFGIPAAMGAQFANPDAVVCCVTGDGSVQMNIQELSTCMQYGVPIKIISINNRALGMVKQWQKMFYGGRHSHSYMESLPDFVKLAEAYGHVGIAVSDPAELESAMEKAFAMKDRLVFMDISVDPDEHVYPMQIKFGAMDEMWLSKTERT